MSIRIPQNPLKEGSDFRNERDVVPAGIRAGPNPQNLFFIFLQTWYPATRRRDRVFLEFLSFFSFFVCFPWASWFRAQGRCSFKLLRARAKPPELPG